MNTQKKIAFFGIKYFPSRGGTSRVAENLIRQLVGEYDVTIYCYKHESAKSYIEGVKAIEIPEIKLGSAGVFIYYLLCYLHIRFLGNYDIIHAHKIDSFFFLPGLAKNTKIIATAHEAPYNRDKWSRFAKAFFKINEKRFLKFDGIKTSISKPLCEYYKEKYGVNVKFIPNGINLYEKEVEISIGQFWPKEVPTESSFVLFAARRIMGTKGLHTMLQACKQIEYKGNIFVAGELDNYPAYIKKVKKLSEGLNVYYLGFVNPLSILLEFVSKSDYFVFPSETEGMSIMLMEVASVGKPIIASDIPENTQIFGGDEVLFFKSKDINDLSEKLKWVERNRLEFGKFGNRAKTKVEKKYTWEHIALEYKSLYKGLIS